MNGDHPRLAAASLAAKSGSKAKDHFSQAFSVLLNYWEIKPTQYEARLQELLLQDVRAISAFVPWAHVESDIYHSLKKFVRAARAVRMRVRLFVMPELGVNYPNAGIPRDLLTNVSNLAVDRAGRLIYNQTAPNVFPLPSFSSPEVLKRFGNYLIKVGSILGEVFAESGGSDFCDVAVGNALFNYYRGRGLPLAEHGDYSAAHVMAFRDFVDREYRSSETAEASPDTFKMQVYESYNRHRFFTHVERLLREKTDMVFSRRGSTCQVRHLDVLNPETDPESAVHGLLAELFESRPSLQRYLGAIVAGGYRNEAIFLGNSGVFRRFNDQEKSFLILASLIHAGEVAVLAEDLMRLSGGFRRKLSDLVHLLREGDYARQTQVTYVAASKFSMEPRTFARFARMAPGQVSVSAGLEGSARRLSERLIFMDPRSVIRLVELVQLLAAAQVGKIVAVPAPMSAVPNYSADALTHYERFRKGREPLKLNIGLSYEVLDYDLGQVVFYDPQRYWLDAAPSQAAGPPPPPSDDEARFFQALLGLAEVRPACGASDPRIQVASYVSRTDPSDRLVFLINPTIDAIDTTLAFPTAVRLAAHPAARQDAAPLSGRSFELSVPPLGVLSMRVAWT